MVFSLVSTIPFSVNAEPTSLPYSIIGDDYLLYYSNGEPTVWTSTVMAKFTYWQCNTARLGFGFEDAYNGDWSAGHHSLYNETKMDDVIDIFDGYGLKVILDNHNLNDHSEYLGSWNWTWNWLNITTHYLDDDRIAGFNIFNEPISGTWATDGPLGSIDDHDDFIAVCKYLIDAIRVIDPDRVIFFPTVYGMSIGLDSVTTFRGALVYAGVTALDNIIYDVVHPYYWEDYPDMDPTSDPETSAEWYLEGLVDDYIFYFGAENCWIGETFAWYPDLTHEDQVTFITTLINGCLERDVGLQIWSYFGKQAWNDEALAASNYLDYPTEEEAEPDTEAPTYGIYSITHSTNKTGTTCLFSSTWTDNKDLSGFIFSTNNTGTWTNNTFTSLYTNPDVAEAVTTLTVDVGVRVEYIFYAKDTSNNWNYTDTRYLITEAIETETEETPQLEEETTPETEIPLSIAESLALQLTISVLAANTILSLVIILALVSLTAMFTQNGFTLVCVLMAGMIISYAFGFLSIFFVILAALVVFLYYSGFLSKVTGND